MVTAMATTNRSKRNHKLSIAKMAVSVIDSHKNEMAPALTRRVIPRCSQ